MLIQGESAAEPPAQCKSQSILFVGRRAAIPETLIENELFGHEKGLHGALIHAQWQI